MGDLRLPGTVVPSNYDLYFDVDMDNFTFSGNETIELEIAKPAKKIALHSSGLNVTRAEMLQGWVAKANVKIDDKKEILTLSFPKAVKGKAKLTIQFSGKLNDDLLGFYRSKYMMDGKEKWLATTQFESAYARRAFPCFDEPGLKATFDVAMRIDKNLKAVSNMPVKNEKTDSMKKVLTFQRTPRMSTYLLYLGVGDFEFLEDNSRVRIVTLSGKKEQGRLALELTNKFLEYFEEYSGIAYPLPKLDMIALPDFASSAMENWGAITFREVCLLFDPKMTSTAVKKIIAMIIAHELWHMWSGDLVTMRWWNDLWLNESFATYMAYKAVDALFPEWKMWEDFIIDETSRAFEDDSLKTTHPIEVEVKNPNEIEEIFDAISYSKGGSILRMLDNYIGHDEFRKGVRDYLLKHSYGNAASEDLWESLEKASSKPIKKVMESWIRQPGYPIVEAIRKKNRLALKQKKFVFGPGGKARWLIPVVARVGDNTVTTLFSKSEERVTLPKAEWFKLNYGQSGFYRAKYSGENLAALRAAASSKQLPATDRWGVQNDLFKLSVNGSIGIDAYLDFIKSLGNEDNYLVLSSACASMRAINFVFCQENFWSRIWPQFSRHFYNAPRKAIGRLGWNPIENESQEDALLRDACIRYLAFAEDKDVLKKSAEKFNAFAKGAGLHPDIKSAVLYATAICGNEGTYEEIKNLYMKTQSPEEKRIFLIALGQFRIPALIEKTLDLSLTANVRVQDLPVVFSSVSSNPASRGVFLKWMKKNWKKLEKYKKSGKLFLTLVEAFINAHVSSEAELRKFFKTRPVKYRMTMNRALEKVKRNSVWLGKNRKCLEGYFS